MRRLIIAGMVRDTSGSAMPGAIVQLIGSSGMVATAVSAGSNSSQAGR